MKGDSGSRQSSSRGGNTTSCQAVAGILDPESGRGHGSPPTHIQGPILGLRLRVGRNPVPPPPNPAPTLRPGRGMEAPKELQATLPLWGTALALLLTSLWLWRSWACAPRDSEGPAPLELAWPSAGAEGVRTCGLVPYKQREPRVRAGEKEEKQEENPNSDNKKIPLPAELEEEDEEETFSFKYSPGKLRGNQYKKMMTKEELEEEQRIELTSDFTCL